MSYRLLPPPPDVPSYVAAFMRLTGRLKSTYLRRKSRNHFITKEFHLHRTSPSSSSGCPIQTARFTFALRNTLIR